MGKMEKMRLALALPVFALLLATLVDGRSPGRGGILRGEDGGRGNGYAGGGIGRGDAGAGGADGGGIGRGGAGAGDGDGYGAGRGGVGKGEGSGGGGDGGGGRWGGGLDGSRYLTVDIFFNVDQTPINAIKIILGWLIKSRTTAIRSLKFNTVSQSQPFH